jgi:MoxR-like ATPase
VLHILSGLPIFFTQRILALTGPAGTAKTTTIRVLAREMGFGVLEWRNAMGDNSSNVFGGYKISA